MYGGCLDTYDLLRELCISYGPYSEWITLHDRRVLVSPFGYVMYTILNTRVERYLGGVYKEQGYSEREIEEHFSAWLKNTPQEAREGYTLIQTLRESDHPLDNARWITTDGLEAEGYLEREEGEIHTLRLADGWVLAMIRVQETPNRLYNFQILLHLFKGNKSYSLEVDNEDEITTLEEAKNRVAHVINNPEEYGFSDAYGF